MGEPTRMASQQTPFLHTGGDMRRPFSDPYEGKVNKRIPTQQGNRSLYARLRKTSQQVDTFISYIRQGKVRLCEVMKVR